MVQVKNHFAFTPLCHDEVIMDEDFFVELQ
ncbi:MAG: hypothetical protein ILNGONEN_02351 [Syntrophorhabdaceae bacterium]|nr:hypothetical protein [Syntrophorhabdaceae bacterium]